jgi:hypothetical protein
MTLIQRAMQSVFGLGKSKAAQKRHEVRDRAFPEGTRFRGAFTSRQIERARLRDEQYRIQSGIAGVSRKERRKMARALAAKAYRVNHGVSA